MFRCVALLVLCLGLVAAGVGKRKKSKHIVKRQSLTRAGPCGDNEFECENGKCIQSEWTCDTGNDCGDNSDETLPECPPPGECTGNHEMACDNGHCVPIEYQCDGEDNCDDGSDERGCREFTCTEGEWQCQNGLCVDQDYMCDGENDCNDGSDELPENCHSRQRAP